MADCKRCQGNGEIILDWDRYMNSTSSEEDETAVAECPDCSGYGSQAALERNIENGGKTDA